jgi:phospho-N-acetylmuramoyl-pentapeptide-transferase
MGPLMIPALKRLKFGQPIRGDGPSTHLKKAGTPTMGGIIFLIPAMVILCILSFEYSEILPLLILTIGFGLVGFIDDYIKIIRKSKDGLSVSQKTIGLLLVSTAFVVYLVYASGIGTDIYLPFTGMSQAVILPVWVYIPFTVIVLYATTNAVNLTDGVDGLAAGVTLIVMIFFTVVASITAKDSGNMLYTAIIAGGCLGFLVYNSHPAKIFMGDCGSLALGGAVAAAAIILKIHWVLLLAGVIYVAEALSDIIQVFSYKTRRKRVFKMAPIHHHFELSGWKENKIVAVFCTVTIVFCVIGGLMLFLS